jgi:Glycosyltransferase family 87
MKDKDPASHWLTERRILVYSRMLLSMVAGAAIIWVFLSRDMVDGQGRPLGFDFITLWAVSYLGLTGHAADAYDPLLLRSALKIAVPAVRRDYLWFYPPPYYLVVLPAALLPYVASYLAFMAATLAGYLIALRRIIRGKTAMWCLAAFPGLWMNFTQGQNAFLTAALAGGALLCLERRPVLAGILIGLLVIKPHLAVLFPLALLAIGAWRAILAAALTALIFTAASVAILGAATWQAFWAGLGTAQSMLEGGHIPQIKMPTVLAAAGLLGAPVAVASIAQAVVAVGGAFVVWRLWRRCRDWPLRGAALMAATFLINPYAVDYDLAWLAFPIAWLALDGLRHGWRCCDREILVAAWALPIALAPIALAAPVPIGPFVLAALLWAIDRRAALWLDRQGVIVPTPSPPHHTHLPI